MSFIFDRVNAVTEVNIPLIGRVPVSALWQLTEIRVTEHAFQRFAQRVMHRDLADDQTRARCVEYLRLAVIVPSLTDTNLCTARLERRGAVIEYIVSMSGCVVTVVTNADANGRYGALVRANLERQRARVEARKAVSKASTPWLSRRRVRVPHAQRQQD